MLTAETLPSPQEQPRAKEQELRAARDAFEHLAQELDELWHKSSLTPAEQRRVDLILNNATIVQELMAGTTPPELKDVA